MDKAAIEMLGGARALPKHSADVTDKHYYHQCWPKPSNAVHAGVYTRKIHLNKRVQSRQ